VANMLPSIGGVIFLGCHHPLCVFVWLVSVRSFNLSVVVHLIIVSHRPCDYNRRMKPTADIVLRALSWTASDWLIRPMLLIMIIIIV
jgi:hypothetical protein